MKGKLWAISLTFAIAACTGKPAPLKRLLSPLGDLGELGAPARAEFCTQDPEAIKPELKYIFLVDQSTSNQTLDDGNAGTDPTGERRFKPIEIFMNELLADNEDDNSIYFSLITFNTYARVRPLTEPGVIPDPPFAQASSFASKVNSMAALIHQVMKEPDEGYTRYGEAMRVARELINKDIEKSKADSLAQGQAGKLPRSSVYAIFLISDGLPKVSDIQSENEQERADAIAAAEKLVRIDPADKAYVDKIVLNAGFYFNGDTEAYSPSQVAAISAFMTDLVNGPDAVDPKDDLGAFVTFPGHIDFLRFAPPERLRRFIVKDVTLRNLNAVWEDGLLRRDSDQDGLSDALELKIGTDPLKRDTDGDGVSDRVEFSTMPCTEGDCQARIFNAFHGSICSSVKPADTSVRPVPYGDRDRDGLNDCEEIILKTNPDSFHSNGSWIPDWLQFVSGLNPNVAHSVLESDPDQDGLTTAREIKLNTPIMTANTELNGVPPTSYKLTKLSETSTRTCYQLEVDGIVFSRESDEFALYLTQGTSVLESRDILRVARARISGGKLTFNRDDLE